MENLLTVEEVAEILRISESTAKIWVSRRRFPVVKVGRLTRISPQDLKDWIEKQTETRREEPRNPKSRKPNNINKSRAFEKAIEDLKRGD